MSHPDVNMEDSDQMRAQEPLETVESLKDAVKTLEKELRAYRATGINLQTQKACVVRFHTKKTKLQSLTFTL